MGNLIDITGNRYGRLEVIGFSHKTDLTDKCVSCEWAMPIKGSIKGVSVLPCVS